MIIRLSIRRLQTGETGQRKTNLLNPLVPSFLARCGYPYIRCWAKLDAIETSGINPRFLVVSFNRASVRQSAISSDSRSSQCVGHVRSVHWPNTPLANKKEEVSVAIHLTIHPSTHPHTKPTHPHTQLAACSSVVLRLRFRCCPHSDWFRLGA